MFGTRAGWYSRTFPNIIAVWGQFTGNGTCDIQNFPGIPESWIKTSVCKVLTKVYQHYLLCVLYACMWAYTCLWTVWRQEEGVRCPSLIFVQGRVLPWTGYHRNYVGWLCCSFLYLCWQLASSRNFPAQSPTTLEVKWSCVTLLIWVLGSELRTHTCETSSPN